MKIVSDENVNGHLVKFLEKSGHDVFEISAHHQGISDREIISLIETWGHPLITEDKDFGELVFAHNLRKVSVIFLRYSNKDLPLIEKHLTTALEFLNDKDELFFITISSQKVRITRL
ncbi:MAG: DUF5615 family PIN-like protein [Bacteroidia bacterium]